MYRSSSQYLNVDNKMINIHSYLVNISNKNRSMLFMNYDNLHVAFTLQ